MPASLVCSRTTRFHACIHDQMWTCACVHSPPCGAVQSCCHSNKSTTKHSAAYRAEQPTSVKCRSLLCQGTLQNKNGVWGEPCLTESPPKVNEGLTGQRGAQFEAEPTAIVLAMRSTSHKHGQLGFPGVAVHFFMASACFCDTMAQVLYRILEISTRQ